MGGPKGRKKKLNLFMVEAKEKQVLTPNPGTRCEGGRIERRQVHGPQHKGSENPEGYGEGGIECI